MRVFLPCFVALLGACSSAPADSGGETSSEALQGCKGRAASTIPASGSMYLTTFGGPGEGQRMSCGGSTRSGSWYYAASRQRYGCGAHVRVEANGKCVVVETDDYGPDVCVEAKAGGPILDASPLVARALFGASRSGWSDHNAVTVTQVAAETPLGPCASSDLAEAPGDSPDPDEAAANDACAEDADCASGEVCVDGACASPADG